MNRHRQINAALALLIAAIAVLGPIVMDGPTELNAIQATADSITDAQAAAQAADAAQPRPDLLATKDQP